MYKNVNAFDAFIFYASCRVSLDLRAKVKSCTLQPRWETIHSGTTHTQKKFFKHCALEGMKVKFAQSKKFCILRQTVLLMHFNDILMLFFFF